jgi:hypothetical protein
MDYLCSFCNQSGVKNQYYLLCLITIDEQDEKDILIPNFLLKSLSHRKVQLVYFNCNKLRGKYFYKFNYLTLFLTLDH